MRGNREAIFTVELPNGQVYSGAAMGVSISEDLQADEVRRLVDDISLFSAGPRTWEIELRGIGPLALKGHDMFHDLLGKGPSEPEGWECPYCGRNWLSTQHKCWDGVVGCGASRPAMWWI